MARAAARNMRAYIDISTAANGSATPANYVDSISVNQDISMIDVTSGGDTNHVYVPALPDASGAISGFVDMAASVWSTLPDGNARKMYLYPDLTNSPTKYIFGQAYFSVAHDWGVSDAIKVSLNWSAAGNWTWNNGV